jgi:hypothetical protein
MTTETTLLPLLLILDANVIIAAHEFGAWDHIVGSHIVCIPSVVLNIEVYFYKRPDGTSVPIDLKGQAGKTIKEISCTADELAALSEQLDCVTDQEIHAGEKEALAILIGSPEYTFCTFDHTAIEVLSLLGLSERGISFEELLKSCGITKRPQYKHTETFYAAHLEKGKVNRVQGTGLRKRISVSRPSAKR